MPPSSTITELESRLAVLALVLALPVLLVMGSDWWFTQDDWAALSRYHLDMDSFLSAYNGHWVSVPVLIFQGLFSLFGLHSYLPCQLFAVLLHLSCVYLGFRLAVKLAVPTWIAAPTMAVLIFFGSGVFNIFFAFQMTLNGSLLAGLLCLFLVTHNGPVDYRNIAAIIVSVVGLMTSALMLPMLTGLFTALLLTYRFKVAVLHILPAVTVYVARHVSRGGVPFPLDADADAVVVLNQIARTNMDVLSSLTQNRYTGGMLLFIALYGVIASLIQLRRNNVNRAMAIPASLAVAWISFTTIAAVRLISVPALNLDLATHSRYLHIGAVLLLPVIAYGAKELTSLWRPLVIAAIGPLLWGVPANLALMDSHRPPEGYRRDMLSLPHSRYFEQLPSDYVPNLQKYDFVRTNISFWRTAMNKNKVPTIHRLSEIDELNLALKIALRPASVDQPLCRPSLLRRALTVQRGEVIIFKNKVSVNLLQEGLYTQPRKFGIFGDNDNAIEILAGPLTMLILRHNGRSPSVCVQSATSGMS